MGDCMIGYPIEFVDKILDNVHGFIPYTYGSQSTNETRR